MDMSNKTPIEMINHWVETQGDDVYLQQPINGKYQTYTWSEVQIHIQQIAGALRHLGLEAGDKVAILSKNCAEWFITDLALMYGGYISVPIYPTANTDTIDHILKHSEAKAIFVGKLDYWQDQEPGVSGGIIRLSLPYDTMPAQYKWRQILKLGKPLFNPPLPKLDDIMTLIYTSGSTGKPKGVIQTFKSYTWTCNAVVRDLKTTVKDRLLSYLPLAHITERVAIEGSSFYSGSSVAFVESLDSFVDDVKRAKPTVFFSVPRLWSLFQQNIIEKAGGDKKLNFLLKVPLVNRLVKSKIRKGLGLDQSHLLGSGSAPIPPSTIDWYHSIGMNISEAWGMTENCAYSIINYPFEVKKIGSVGKPIEGVQVRLGDNDELLIKSPGLMQGYYRQEQETEKDFDQDGFFHTGDVCTIDDGCISITGRLKDNFKTSKGKYISPVPIESELAQDHYIELICVIGAGLPHPIALVQLSERAMTMPKEEIRASLKKTLDTINPSLESHETLDAVIVVQEPWTIENDMLTPTLKIKRHNLEAKFNSIVDGIRGGEVIWEEEI